MKLEEAKEIIKNTPAEFNIAQPHVLYFEAVRFLEGYEAGVRESIEVLQKYHSDFETNIHIERVIKLFEKVTNKTET